MIETKFTPGNWIVEDHRGHGDWRVSDHIWARSEDEYGPGKRICTINWDKIGSHSDPKEIEERTANAHLIAAAPELYKALKLFADYLEEIGAQEEDEHTLLEMAHSVLAKARGEP